MGPRALQTAEPLLVLWFVGEVEAGGHDAQLHVPVLAQELHDPPRTVEAGAPGHEPSNVVFLVTGQILGQECLLRLEPIQEADFCVDRLPRIELVFKDPRVK